MTDDKSDIAEPADALELTEPDSPPHGRPTLVYAALGVGAAVLALLLLIVWISSGDDEAGDGPLCLDIALDSAEAAVLAGGVEQIDVLLDSQDPLHGLTAIQIHMTSGECRRLPEGADNRSQLYELLGVVSLYNEEGEQRVDINYQRQDVPLALLQTSTAIPTDTAVPSATIELTPAPDRTPREGTPGEAISTPIPLATPTSPFAAASDPATSTSVASPSPAGSAVASPVRSPAAD